MGKGTAPKNIDIDIYTERRAPPIYRWARHFVSSLRATHHLLSEGQQWAIAPAARLFFRYAQNPHGEVIFRPSIKLVFPAENHNLTYSIEKGITSTSILSRIH
jgi:hypothetical protein